MEGRLGRLIERVKPKRKPLTHTDLERRIPGYREKMARAVEDYKAGIGVVLNPDGTVTQVGPTSRQRGSENTVFEFESDVAPHPRTVDVEIEEFERQVYGPPHNKP